MKLQRIICIFLVLIFGLITLSYADENQLIVCNDKNLYNALCSFFGDSKIIKKDSEKMIIEVSKETISAVTELDLSSKNISDLKGLEVFTGLNTLRVSNNQISNVSAIRNLKNMQYLYLNKNNISDLSVLTPTEANVDAEGAEIENLMTIIDLSENKIADISSLATFKNLVTLNLNSNQINSIDVVSSFEKLESLFLNNNKITDISAIGESETLKALNLQNNQITKIESLKLENIESLNLKNNRLTNVDFLNGMNTLNSLDLSYNQIVKIPEFFANWINNKQIPDIKMNNQTLNLVTQNNEINFGKNSSYTNLLYFGFFYNPDLKVGLENGKLDTDKLVFTLADANKTGKMTITDGVFKNSTIRIDYGGSTDVETAPSDDKTVVPDDEKNEAGTNNDNTQTNTSTDVNTNTENNANTDNNTNIDTNTNTGNAVTNSENTVTNNQTSGDSTTANGKMPYTGVASKVAVIITFVAVVVIGGYTFSKNKK